MAKGEIAFDIRRGEDLIRVHIKDEYATIVVSMIDDVWPVYKAFNQAVASGAKRGVLFTGMVVDDQLAAMHMMRSKTGITWMGGKVTYLGMLSAGPEFRIDFDELPTVTE